MTLALCGPLSIDAIERKCLGVQQVSWCTTYSDKSIILLLVNLHMMSEDNDQTTKRI